MAFQAEELALEVIGEVRGVVERIKGRDKALADQLARALNSVLLNLGEGNHSDPGNRRARFFTASGSANEARLALRGAVQWGHCDAAAVEPALARLRSITRILWKLTH